MTKLPHILFISVMLAIYMAAIGLSLSTQTAGTLPETVDPQILTVSEGQLFSDQQPANVTLPVYFDVLDETRLQFTLNYAFSGKTVPSLLLQANHSFMTILLDGEEIYHVEPQPYSLGNYYAHIPLPQKATGALLEIQVSVPKSGLTRIEIPELIIANEAVFLKQQVRQDVPSLLLNTMILSCGIFLLLLAFVGRKHVNPYRMLLRGFLALNCALYFMCETYSVLLFAPTARTVYIMDMLLFASLASPLLLLLGRDLKDWRGKLLYTIAGLGAVSVFVQIALSILCKVELRRLLPLTHTVQIVGIVAMVICLVYGLIRKKSNRGLYIGGLVALGGALDLVLFLCEIGQNNVFFLKIGLLAYSLQQMYQFVRLLMHRSAEDARESYYKTLAMQDPLSRCYSRAAFELDKNAWTGETVRTAFSLDLNDLKSTNDLYGHGAGDQVIHNFGGVLSRVFLSVGKCYRVGGDEFWVFCDDLAPGKADEMLRSAQLATDAYNHNSNPQTKLSYAAGICDTSETQGCLATAIELADARMYENKRAAKQPLQ